MMAGGLLNLCWVLSVLQVLLMVQTVSGARGPSTGPRGSSQFPASGVNQTLLVDVSIQARQWHQVGGIFKYLLSIYYVPGTELNPEICQGIYTADKSPCPHGVKSPGRMDKEVNI